jgi:hypothetical protein
MAGNLLPGHAAFDALLHAGGKLAGSDQVHVQRRNVPEVEEVTFYGPLAHARDLGEKDLSLALALGDTVGIDLPMAEMALKNLATGLGVPHTKE